MTNRYSILMGVVASLLGALFTALFGIFIVLDNKVIYFLVCLLLSFSVVAMVVSMRAFISQEKKVFINCAVAFAIMYAVLVGMVYFTHSSLS